MPICYRRSYHGYCEYMKIQKLNIKKIKQKKKEDDKNVGPLFLITQDGIDVIVNKDIGGHWKGFLFSELRDDLEGRKLLYWVVRSDFPKRVKEIAQELIDGA